jgi:hypothetical protein
MTDQQFEISVDGPGTSVKKTVDASIAQQVVLLIFGAQTIPSIVTTERGSSGPSGIQSSSSSEMERPPAIREYLNGVQASQNTMKIAAIAMYLYKYEGKKTFTHQDVKEGFEQARERMPANLSRDMSETAGLGWIAPSREDPKAFYLTNTGEIAVNQGFPKETRKSVSRSRTKGKKKKSKTSEIGATDSTDNGSISETE